MEAVHQRIYENLLAIRSPGVRAQMIQTILSSPEHSATMRAAGVYGHLLHYVQVVQAGGAPPPLPFEKRSGEGSGGGRSSGGGGGASSGSSSQAVALRQGSGSGGGAVGASQKGNERAMNYFSACLRILNLEEEVALTETALKSAYKKAVLAAHPDKGGSEKEFEAVTRAYAYLGEILKRIHGGRSAEGKVEAPVALQGNREQDADKWKMVEPVQLNAKNLDMNRFNTMFEKTRIPDPEESGYGDWLKGGEEVAESQGPKFSGKFNREVFQRAFEDENKKRQPARQQGGVMTVQEQSLASRLGYATELGRTARDDYTVAANDPGLKYTDLKKAYTEYNTFSQETAGVNVQARSLDEYTKNRDKAPAPLADNEMAAIVAAEKSAAAREEQRKLRVAQEAVEESSYFERMKRLVIRN
jgi:curved DNA-binding protein CbpA